MAGFGKYSTGKAKEKEELKYEIIEHFGKLTDNPNAYNKELNLISWNGADPKFDIRPWKETEEKGRQMAKGITLTAEEIEALYQILHEVREKE